ncbi:hypothetical protein ALC56_12362 [Trachymyrmex septentrionalis]|uniref:Uncharacterized protein n=1 Tax=Trachymyrmex septentrionalis TaxID=34720 RepID=A0A195EZB7_9HYME|nr:hypothetical protein ALC56_12362 [Trachymyrmex septentrionalis]
MVAESPERAVCSSFHKPPVCISLHTAFQGNNKNASALLVTGLFSLIDYLNLGLRIYYGLREKQKLARSLHRTFPSGPTFSGSHPFCFTHTRGNRTRMYRNVQTSFFLLATSPRYHFQTCSRSSSDRSFPRRIILNTPFTPISNAGGKLEPALLTTSSRCRPFATSRTSTQHPVAFTADPGVSAGRQFHSSQNCSQPDYSTKVSSTIFPSTPLHLDPLKPLVCSIPFQPLPSVVPPLLSTAINCKTTDGEINVLTGIPQIFPGKFSRLLLLSIGNNRGGPASAAAGIDGSPILSGSGKIYIYIMAHYRILVIKIYFVACVDYRVEWRRDILSHINHALAVISAEKEQRD